MHDLIRQRRKADRKSQRKAKHTEVAEPDFVFFHLAKTGGGSVRQFLGPIRDRWAGAGHQQTLDGIQAQWPDAPMVFFVRDPIRRYVSGFNNFRRAVVHKPVGKLPSKIDLVAYRLFPTANDLAEGLLSDDEHTLSAAHWAIGRLGFLSHHLTANLGDPATVDRHLPNIALIGLFEQFEASVEAMRTILELPARLHLPEDEGTAHRGLSHLPTRLSDAGLGAINEWYRDDIVLYEHCRRIHDEQLKAINGD